MGDGQAEAGSTVLAGGRGIHLPEGLKEALQLAGLDADPGVLDLEAHPHVLAIPGFQAGPQGDLAAGGEFHRVAGEVEQALAQAGRIADQGDGDVVVIDGQLQPLCFGRLGDQGAHVVDDRTELEAGVLEGQLAGLDLGDVENVVDDRQQVMARVLDLVEAVDTTNFTTFTAGTFTPVATWVTLSPATGYDLAGGDADEIDVTTLLDNIHKVDFGLLGAETVNFNQLSDTQAVAALQIEAAARAGTDVTFRITLPNGERRVFRGVPSLPGESLALSQAANSSFKVAVKGRVLRLPVA